MIAAQPPNHWATSIDANAARLGISTDTLRRSVASQARSFNADQRRFSNDQLGNISSVRARMETATNASPTERWANLGRTLDRRLTVQKDWPATAAMLQQIHDSGHDVHSIAERAVAAHPLGETPAQDLRYRLVSNLPDHAEPITPTVLPQSPRIDPAHRPIPNLEQAPNRGPQR